MNKLTFPILQSEFQAKGLNLKGDGTLDLTVDNKETSLWVTGRAKTAVNQECSRCLTDISQNLETKLSFFAERKEASAPVVESDDENLFFFTENDDELDISGLVTEELLVNLPMKAVCREDCLGLCPRCGVNLNSEVCRCPPAAPDARWAPLLKLKKE